jgi:hypothetical protein
MEGDAVHLQLGAHWHQRTAPSSRAERRRARPERRQLRARSRRGWLPFAEGATISGWREDRPAEGLGFGDHARLEALHPPHRPSLAASAAVLRFLSLFLSQLYMSTPEQSGDALAQLVLGQVTPPPGKVYASRVRGKITFPDPSRLAQSDDARDLLWRGSAAMVALPA